MADTGNGFASFYSQGVSRVHPCDLRRTRIGLLWEMVNWPSPPQTL